MAYIPGTPTIPENPLVARDDYLKMRKAILREQARRNAEQLGIVPEGQMVSGHYVAPSAGELLANLGTKAVNKYNEVATEKELKKEEGSLRSDIEAAFQRAVATGQDKPFSAPGIDEADAAQASAGNKVAGDRVGMARQLSQIPGYEQLGQATLTDELVKGPEREEQRRFRASEAAATRQQQAELARERIAAAAEAARLRSEDVRLGIEQRREAAREANALRAQLAAMNADLRRDMAAATAAKGAAGRTLPAGTVRELSDLEGRASAFTNLKSTFKDEFSGLRGAVESAVGSYLPGGSEGADWWKSYRMSYELPERHAMFGATMTQGEKEAWKSANISPGMDDATIKRNLARQEKVYTDVYNRMIRRYGGSGYNTEAFPERGAAPSQGGAGGSWGGPPQGWSVQQR